MKKFTLIIVLAVLATAASAQVKFGFKGGLNVTDMSVSSDVVDGSNRTGWFIGPTLKVGLPIVGLGFDVSALYEQRSSKATDNTEYVSQTGSIDKTVKQNAINIPINVRYDIGLGSLASVFFAAGPQFGFNVGHKVFKLSSYEDTEWELKSSNFSVNVGLGVVALKHLQVSANYNIGLGKTGEVTFLDAAKKQIKKSTRDNTWQIALAYYF